MTPIPVGERLDATQARRLAAGCEAIGTTHLRHAALGTGATAITTRNLPADASVRPPTLLWTPDHQAALLFPSPGHALLAGSTPFMAAAVPEGIDAARARFTRYARKQAARHPELLAVAATYAPAHHAWSDAVEVPPNTATAHHLHLLQEFTNGTLPAPAFAHAWWQTRRTAQSNGERVRGPLEELFTHVFLLLEDYELDPELAEPTDLTATELQAAVTEVYRDSVKAREAG
ncbi:hypothetical protein ACFV13_10275 [Streptomyces bauhiniae]|uniref:hypothetical protein n=1 Tax=Streptomyces bauhiniae TaxID=2340725 RepID=UPI00369C7825